MRPRSPETADPRWNRLSPSAEAAWRWAWATAAARTGAAEPSGVLVDTVDLLAGLALAHLRDSPISQLLAHFHIPPGALLSDGGERTYQVEAIRAAARRIPDGTIPQVDAEAGRVLEHARTEIPPSSDGLVHLSMLAAALLETSNTASRVLRTELANRGVDVEAVLRSCREYLDARASYADYAEYLHKNHPYQPPERQLPPYAPDEPRTRRPPRKPGAEPPDLVGITAEVDAFAYLIASKTLTPPLAIGLFGDWGSGKSYFLRSMQRRIDQLVRTEVAQPPFYRKIAQIEFNAWQYVEGNLWASLLEHLFRNLRCANEDTDDLLEARRHELLTQIAQRTEEHRRAVKKRKKLAAKRRQVHKVVQDKISKRDRKLADLEEARRRNPLHGWKPSEELSRTLAKAGIDIGPLATQADELQRKLASTDETLRRAGPVLAALRTGGWRYAVALIVAMALVALISFILRLFDVSAVQNVITSVLAFLALMTALAELGNQVLAGTLRAVSRVQAQVDRQRKEHDQQIRQAEIALAGAERAVESAEAKEQQLAASVAELQAELARITPSSVLAEFVSNRFASDDYRRHLGLPALVRQDLELLSRLIQRQHEGDSVIAEKHAIDRIVLYIDDLDRCPTDLVIKVLEAVHLLLAFPLFVVVVAVDARWLETSLQEHYTQLRDEAAMPTDYLEKVFQVPFWVRPLGTDIRRQMVRGLLTPSLASPVPATGDGEGAVTETDLSDADLMEFTRVVESFGVTDQAERPWLQAAALTVTPSELRVIEDVSGLIGATPRAVKRFINVYLLLKSVGRSRGWPMPEKGQIAVLLAVAIGLPSLANELLRGGPEVRTEALRTLVDRTVKEAAGAQLDRLNDVKAWLDQEHPAGYDNVLIEAERWVDLILRFRFDRFPRSSRSPKL